MEYSNEYAQDFSNKNFGKVRGVRNLYADGRVPNGYTKVGDLVYNSNGKICMGSCQYLGKRQSDVYLYKSAFVNGKELYLTMGHEYMHANFNYLGLRNSNSQHASIFMWEYQQCHSWNYYPVWLSSHNPFSPSVIRNYRGNDFWFDYFDFRYKAFPIAK